MTVAAVTLVRPALRRSLKEGRERCDGDGDRDDYGCRHRTRRAPQRTRHFYTSAKISGSYYSCAGLESLWISAGGRPGSAYIAAEIAKAESGGYVFATGRAGERGLWQIAPGWGSVLSTYNPYGNARAAVIISHDGSNWSPWTTYTSGLYRGRC